MSYYHYISRFSVTIIGGLRRGASFFQLNCRSIETYKKMAIIMKFVGPISDLQCGDHFTPLTRQSNLTIDKSPLAKRYLQDPIYEDPF